MAELRGGGAIAGFNWLAGQYSALPARTLDVWNGGATNIRRTRTRTRACGPAWLIPRLFRKPAKPRYKYVDASEEIRRDRDWWGPRRLRGGQRHGAHGP